MQFGKTSIKQKDREGKDDDDDDDEKRCKEIIMLKKTERKRHNYYSIINIVMLNEKIKLNNPKKSHIERAVTSCRNELNKENKIPVNGIEMN